MPFSNYITLGAVRLEHVQRRNKRAKMHLSKLTRDRNAFITISKCCFANTTGCYRYVLNSHRCGNW
jgi:hypothetical protein